MGVLRLLGVATRNSKRLVTEYRPELAATETTLRRTMAEVWRKCGENEAFRLRIGFLPVQGQEPETIPVANPGIVCKPGRCTGQPHHDGAARFFWPKLSGGARGTGAKPPNPYPFFRIRLP